MDRKDRWSQLSMKQKADLIKLYVESGITNIDDIKKGYNSFDTGGHTESLYYDDTYIEPAVVKAFKNQKDYNRYLGEKGSRAVREGTNKIANTIAKGLRFTPVVGDVMDGVEAYEEAKTGNLTKAGVLAGLTLLPNAVEKPVKAVGKGLKNLRLYNRYIKDVDRFKEPVGFALKGMEENYDLLKSNFPEMNTIEDAKRTMNTTVSTKLKPLKAIKNKASGKYDFGTGDIWLNAYAPTRIKQAWKSPKVAIRNLKKTAAHEGTHSALDNLNIVLSEYDKKNYGKVVSDSPVNAKTSTFYNKADRKATNWQNLPEEFISEMNGVRYALGEKPGSSINSWSVNHATRGKNYLSKTFDFEPGEAKELMGIYEGFGFADGGRLNRFATGGPTENNWEIPFSLEPTTVPITKYNYYTLAPEAVQIPIRDIKQKYAMAPELIALDEEAQIKELKERAAKEYSFGVSSDVLDDIGNQEKVNKRMLASIYHNNQPDTNKYINSTEVDVSPKIKITAPNTDISKFIYGNNISEEAIKEIKQVASKRNLDPYDILAHMLIESSGEFNGITRNSYFNTHDVLDRQISPRLLDSNNSRNIETLLRNLGVYNESRQYTNEEIRDYILNYGKQLQEAISNIEYPSSTIDAVGLRISKFGRDFNPAQKGFKSIKGEVKNSYLDMIDSAITSLKENMPDLFK